MKSVSVWARQHKTTARISIILIYLLLNIIGIFTGDLLYSMNIVLPFCIYLAAVALIFTGLAIYPSKKNKLKYIHFYRRQKFADCLLISATFILIIFTGNSVNQPANYNPVYGSFILNRSAHFLEKPSTTVINKNRSTVSKKDGRKYFRSTVKELRKKFKESTKGQKTLYIILAVIGALFLIFLLGALSCNIACSGSEAIAYVIFILGLGGIIFGLIKLIQRITKGKRKKPIQQPLE